MHVQTLLWSHNDVPNMYNCNCNSVGRWAVPKVTARPTHRHVHGKFKFLNIASNHYLAPPSRPRAWSGRSAADHLEDLQIRARERNATAHITEPVVSDSILPHITSGRRNLTSLIRQIKTMTSFTFENIKSVLKRYTAFVFMADRFGFNIWCWY